MNGRDKRRKVKQRKAPVPGQVHNTAGTIVLPKKTEPINGKFCRVRNAKIEISVCTVQSTRTPDLCEGCA